jgi:hypothetical protein
VAPEPAWKLKPAALTGLADRPAPGRNPYRTTVINGLFDATLPGQAASAFAQDAQDHEPVAAGSWQRAEQKPPPTTIPARQRWAFDQWVLLRGGAGALATAQGAASYGASQAGAVARYRLDAGGQHDAYGYVRTSAALNTPGKDRELALGIGVRPLANVPLRLLGEARVFDSASGPVRLRPVVTVITELPWQKLAGGLRAEVFGQAGYAGGAGATAFFDVQAVVDHAMPKALGIGGKVRIGAGVWAGGQKGAVRLDAGPRVSLPVDLGNEAGGRIALDWRLRVGGNANPASGPALTIASSF